MKIRSKIIMITLPLLITPLILTLLVSILSTRNGITLVATEFLSFKSEVLNNYIESQWTLLVNNELDSNEEFIQITKSSIQDFAGTLIGGSSERIFAVDNGGRIVMSTSALELSDSDNALLAGMINNHISGWQNLNLSEIDMVANISRFEPFDWYLLVTVERNTFYGTITNILIRTGMIFFLSLLSAIILLILFSSYLTRPLEKIVTAIKTIIQTNDLSTKVSLEYKDETGTLGHYFNIMIEQLDKAHIQMKRYALQAVVAKHKESKIRNIFQKYVPKDVIDRFYEEPESMLVGENRVLAVLFSDIRSFTTISEGMAPDELVDSLNKYFEYMVDVITSHSGVVDKYIGDAIMAFFGAPVRHDNDALSAVMAGLEMSEKLDEFNQWQRGHGRAEFTTGIGINYGVVTIGNIGSEKKMDYTVIGDMVNLASRLEGLTKLYKEPLLISESMYKKVGNDLPCRKVDRVIVKGKTRSTDIYAVRRSLTPEQKEAWESHETGLDHYYRQEFQEAASYFSFTHQLMPDDHCSKLFLDRCHKYIEQPPGEDWSGDTVLNRK